MLWKLFGNNKDVERALRQSVGYDISPDAPKLQLPANDGLELPKVDKTSGKIEAKFIAPWDEEQSA
ncbi:MAG TPA: hypothetical protein VEF76_00760 [Patescibacteria group bacterium]|nr:hypothetical protein [Patescibacteria group bacterium]